MHQIDTSFKEARQASAARRRRLRVRRWLIGGAGLAALLVAAGTIYYFVPDFLGLRPDGTEPLEEVEAAAEPIFIPAIVDLAGDPLRISIGEDLSGSGRMRTVARPQALPAARIPGDIVVLEDTMITSSQRFMTTLPSTPQDFAYYQSQRLAGRAAGPEAPDASDTSTAAVPAGGGELPADMVADEGAGWGEDLTGSGQAASDFEKTRVADTTSVAFVRAETARFRPDNDYFARILADRSIEDLFGTTYAEADADAFGAAMENLLDKAGLATGEVVAIRSLRDASSAKPRVVQLSIYSSTTYIGTLARAESGEIVLGADPWVPEDLFNYGRQQEVAEPGRQYRLLDAVYSTAVRNRVPNNVLGEAIMLLSRSFDLNAFATPEDRLVIAYSSDAGAEGDTVGRVLYAAVRGVDRDIECFVFRRSEDSYSCFAEEGGGLPTTVPSGMFTPVKGVLTSTFGPRRHPIFKDVRVHTGVDWAAPSGTPVAAAFAGEVSFAGNGGGYGNLLRIRHPDGRETYYAHLKAFAEGIAPGKAIGVGEVVGFVGTTGNSTGPHLHFEMRIAGAPVDPLQSSVLQAGLTTLSGSAVDVLTEQIVAVESGGRADAQNPLSTATGVGQFIAATWVRMMRTYRPDLARTLSEPELLNLRFDPTISREMVQNLAREGEAYLKARGHTVTAGRLYLAHFLGMEDAHRVLASPPQQPLDAVLAQSVLSANPFLVGKDAAYVVSWAEAKMAGTRIATAPSATARPASPEFQIYKKAIEVVLAPQVPQTADAGRPSS
ncbi:M23 family metallopeptidase [Devosia nitrariae]|nr:M23 family metallopeptidase [Devosia nitrariae]